MPNRSLYESEMNAAKNTTNMKWLKKNVSPHVSVFMGSFCLICHDLKS